MIIRRYISTVLFQAIAVFFVVLLVIVFLFDCLSQLTHTNIPLWRNLFFVLCLLPAHAYDLMPMAVFMGAFYAFTALGQRSELIVMRTFGMSPVAMCRHVAAFCIALMGMTYVWGEYVVPVGLDGAVSLRGQQALSFFGGETGLWLKDGRYFIHIGVVDRGQHLRQLRAFGFSTPTNWQFVDAQTAYFDDQRQVWCAVGVDLIRHDVQGLYRRHTAHWCTPFRMSVHAITALLMPLRYMGIRNAFFLQQQGQHNDTNTYFAQTAFWRQLLYPFFIPLLLCLAIAMAYHGHYRVSGRGMNIALGFFMSIVLYTGNNILMTSALLLHWPVILSVLSPLCVFMILLLGYCRRLAR